MSGPEFVLKVKDSKDDLSFTTIGGFRLTAADTMGNRLTGRGIFISNEIRKKWVEHGNILAPMDLWLSFDNGSVDSGTFVITDITYVGITNGEPTYDITIQRVILMTSSLSVPTQIEATYGTRANTVAVPIEITDEIIASITAVLIFNCVLPVTGEWSDLARKLHAAVLDGVKETN